MDTTPAATIDPARLRAVLADILHAAGASRPDAEATAELLVEADLRGIDSHGSHLIGLYVSRLRAGHIRPDATLTIIRDDGPMLLLDAGLGLGQPAGLAAIAHGVERSARHGVSVVAVREATHLGALAAYTERAARAGRICLCFQNGPVLVPPYGSVTPLLSTNPLSYAIPAGEADPIVFDIATTAVAGNKLLLAKKRGDTELPAGWANDTRGLPTTDPAAASVDHLQWFGGHKGFGLALLVEVLAGALTGSCFGTTENSAGETTGRERVAKGFLFVTIDPARLMPPEDFAARVDALIHDIHTAEPAEGVARVLVPGQLEHERRRSRERDGIPLPAALVADIDRHAADFALPGLTREAPTP